MDAAALVTPPYVAGPLRLHPFAALMLVPSRVGDPSTGRAFARPYRGVAARLTRWQERGLVHADTEPALYLHEYTSSGMTVRGLVGALDVARRATRPEDRVVYPHEGIHPAQADDLADRMAEMRLNPAPILLVHRGSPRLRSLQEEVMADAPTVTFTDRSEQHHRIWPIRDADRLEVAATELATTRAVIADGHHRYAAYLRLQRRQPGGPCDRGLAMLVDQVATPLFLGAIHRTLTGTTLADLGSAAESIGLAHRTSDQGPAMAALGPDRLVATDGRDWAVIELRPSPDRAAVEVLHDDLVPALAHGPTGVDYHHSVEDAMGAVQPGRSVAVLLPAPSADLIERIAAADRLLPTKATSFQPKPSLGVLIRSLRAEADDHR